MDRPGYKLNLVLVLGALFTIAVSSCGARSVGKWEVVRSENLAHAAVLEQIAFDQSGEGWALTWADLYRVRNQGKTWFPVLTNQGMDRSYASFAFTTPDKGTVVGTQKKGDAYTVLILQTSDSGQSWEESATDVQLVADKHNRPSLQTVAFFDEMMGWAVGEDLILRTVDGGKHWETQYRVSNGERLFSIACPGRDRAAVVGTGGSLVTTKDGGLHWVVQALPTHEALTRIRFFGNGGWIVGGSHGAAVLFRTEDGGENWVAQQLSVNAALFDVFFIGSRGWIVGEKGTVLGTEDGGSTWHSEEAITTQTLTSVFFLSPKVGWVGGDRLTLLRFVG
jgi:photosystem II stability/assembly factor-like uncharacterized protein